MPSANKAESITPDWNDISSTWNGMMPFPEAFMPQKADLLTNTNAIEHYGQMTPPPFDSSPRGTGASISTEESGGESIKGNGGGKRTTSNSAKNERRRKRWQEVQKDENLRDIVREKNRVAANKSRQKKRAWIEGLEQQAKDLNVQKMQLKAMERQLRVELLGLKERCLEHVDCDCGQIRSYLSRNISRAEEGRRYSEGDIGMFGDYHMGPQQGYGEPSSASSEMFMSPDWSGSGGMQFPYQTADGRDLGRLGMMLTEPMEIA
ncbi:hypothetical protein LTS18_003199 [Coniosporium uncinatum]|uniref:Uncharacterized protein n=1 Tax=Coniosporium uncinatum TaxID=93489 RepID=A0ACC3DTT7_9PEZI|nr:hypothetical protein LTS18_003199 [Coniosporium uncinatum]